MSFVNPLKSIIFWNYRQDPRSVDDHQPRATTTPWTNVTTITNERITERPMVRLWHRESSNASFVREQNSRRKQSFRHTRNWSTRQSSCKQSRCRCSVWLAPTAERFVVREVIWSRIRGSSTLRTSLVDVTSVIFATKSVRPVEYWRNTNFRHIAKSNWAILVSCVVAL